MLAIRITGSEEVQRRFANMPAGVRAALRAKVFALTLMLEAHVKNDKLSGQVLNTVTGRLKRSIQSRVTEDESLITGSVFSSGDVPYAAIHEFGGKTSPHDIVPVKAKALAFMMNGKMVFAKIVHHPGSVMPERSYLRSSLDDMHDRIVNELTQAVRGAVQ
jgi:phage gpG-like protein